jgi:hypothetical protein
MHLFSALARALKLQIDDLVDQDRKKGVLPGELR